MKNSAAQMSGGVAHMCAAVMLAGAAVLYRFPPAENSFYPRCPVFSYLHVLCPGCGGTRALAALLRLRFAEAIQHNALVVILAPVVAVYLARARIGGCAGENNSPGRRSRRWASLL